MSKIKHDRISKVKFKYQSLYDNSNLKKFGWNDMVVNISNTTLSTLETETLKFGLKFATIVKHHDKGKLIDMNYRHYNSNFYIRGWHSIADKYTYPGRIPAA